MDTGFVAGLDSVCWHAAFVAAGFRPGPGALEPARHLPLCCGVRRDGTSPAWDDSRLWRSRFVRAVQMALYSRAALPSRGLYGLFLVGPQGNSAGRFLLGRLARIDANLWVLPYLRCQSWNLRRAHPPARFRDVRNLVRHSGCTFTIPAKRHARYVLHVWRTLYPAISRSSRPTTVPFRGRHGLDPLSAAFRSAVDHRQATQPREGGFTRHQHRVLVVLQ